LLYAEITIAKVVIYCFLDFNILKIPFISIAPIVSAQARLQIPANIKLSLQSINGFSQLSAMPKSKYIPRLNNIGFQISEILKKLLEDGISRKTR
jgi:hypothetical protein